MSKTEQDDIVKNLKACVSSNRGGIPVSALCRKYRAVSLLLFLDFIYYYLCFLLRAFDGGEIESASKGVLQN